MNILIVFLFFSLFTDIFQIFAVANYGVTLDDLVLLAIFVLFIKKIIWDGEKLEFSYHPALIFLLAMPLAALLSGFTPLIKGSTPQMIQYFKTTSHLFFLIFFAIICAFSKIEIKAWINVVKFLLIISIFINLFGVYQMFARAYDLPLAWIQITNVSSVVRLNKSIEDIQQLSLRYGNFFRATSIFPEPSALASFNIIIQVLLIIPYVQKVKPFLKSKLVNGIVYSSSIIALFLSFSMTGFVGLALVFVFVLLFNSLKKIFSIVGVFLISLVILLVTDKIVEQFSGVSVANLFGKRLSGIIFKTQGTAGESFTVRLSSGKVGIEIWEKHFINGAGLGLTAYNNRKGVKFGDFSVTACLAEMGIIGFISFVGLFASLFYITYIILKDVKNRNDLPDEVKQVAGILFYLMLHQFIINFVSGNNLVKSALWVFVGLILSVINNYLMLNKNKIYSIQIVKKPLKYSINNSILKYLNSKD